MARSIEQILTDVKSANDKHERQLVELQDEAEKSLLATTIEAEKKIGSHLKALLPEFDQAQIGDDKRFKILNNEANMTMAAEIYSIVQTDLQPFTDDATAWAMEYLTDAYKQGTEATVDSWNAGSDDDIAYSFNENDAMVMGIALTKGYGKNQRGIGMIKDLSQSTADNIRDIMVKGIAERRTTTDLYNELVKPEVGLTSLEITDSLGRTRTMSMQQRAKLIAQNEIAQIYQTAATEKAHDVFGEDAYWKYGSVYELTRMTDWCKKRFGRVAKISEWNDPNWVRSQFGDSKTGTGDIHVNCRQSGTAVTEDWFSKSDWKKTVDGQHILTGEDKAEYERDPDKKIPIAKIWGETPKTVISRKFRTPREEEIQEEPDPDVFKPKETIQELEDWANNAYPDIRFDFTETHIDIMNPTIEQFDKLAKEYPEVADRLEYVGSGKGEDAPEEILQTFRTQLYGSAAYASRDGTKIGLSTLRYSDPKDMEDLNIFGGEVTIHGVSQGRWMPLGCNTPEGIMTHEFGHHVQNWLEVTNAHYLPYVEPSSGIGMVTGTLWEWQKNNKARASLSWYALESEREAFAEGFAAIYHMPKSRRPVFVKRLEKLLGYIANPDEWHKDGLYLSDIMFDEEEIRKSLELFKKVKKELHMKD